MDNNQENNQDANLGLNNNLNSGQNDYYNNDAYYNNSNYSDNYNDTTYEEKSQKNNMWWKILAVILVLLIVIVLLLKFCGGEKSNVDKHTVLQTKLCTAANKYVDINPTIIDKTIPGTVTVIKLQKLSDANLIEARIENPNYNGSLFKKGTEDKYYSMNNSVRMTVLTDGTLNCEMVNNSDDVTAPELRLNGDLEIELLVGVDFEDPGYTATDDYDGDVTSNVVRSGNVDSTTAGEYTITYSVSDSAGNTTTKTRKVIYNEYGKIKVTLGSILDTVTPMISLKGANPYCMIKGTQYVEPGAIATDNVDGDITNKIVVINKVSGNLINDFRVTYKVVDSSGNESIAYRAVAVRTECPVQKETELVVNTAPKITLIGKNSITISKGTEYVDLGAEAWDKEDGDLTSKITVNTSRVKVNVPGSYTVDYKVVDSGEKIATAIRNVTVKDTTVAPTSKVSVRFTEHKDNINVQVGKGNNSLISPPKAVNENNVAVAVSTKIVDQGTTESINAIDWNNAGKYKVTYTAMHGNGKLSIDEHIVVTITAPAPVINGNSITLEKRTENCGLSESDLIKGGITFEPNLGNLNVEILSTSNGDVSNLMCKAGTSLVTIIATDNTTGVMTEKNIYVEITEKVTPGCSVANCKTCNTGSTTTCKTCNTGYTLKSGKCELTCTAANCKTCKAGSTTICTACNTGYTPVNGVCKQCTDTNCAICKAGEPATCTTCKEGYERDAAGKCTAVDSSLTVKLTKNSSNQQDFYNKNGVWVGGNITEIQVGFSVGTTNTKIKRIDVFKDCTGDRMPTGSRLKINYNDSTNTIGLINWLYEGSTTVCIRAINTAGVAGPMSDPIKMNLDKTGPTIKFTHAWKDGPDDWHKTASATVKYSSEDSESGLDHFEYTYDDVKAKKAEEITTHEEKTGSLKVSNDTEPSRPKLYVYVRAVDKAGNPGKWTENPAYVNLDTTAPADITSSNVKTTGNKTPLITIKLTGLKDYGVEGSRGTSGIGKVKCIVPSTKDGYTSNGSTVVNPEVNASYKKQSNGEVYAACKFTSDIIEDHVDLKNFSVNLYAVDKAGNLSLNPYDINDLEITKSVPVTGITLKNGTTTIAKGAACSTSRIYVGTPITLTATVIPDKATDKSVTWGSSEGSVATIENGKITTSKVGTTTITAKNGNIETNCVLTVSTQSSTPRTVNVNGAVSETISYYGISEGTTASGSFTTDASGVGSVTLPIGTYNFVSNVAPNSIASTCNGKTYNKYCKSVIITEDTTTVNAYPDGAVFWYGNGDQSSESLYSITGGFSSQDYSNPPNIGNRGYLLNPSHTNDTRRHIYNGQAKQYTRQDLLFTITNKIPLSGYSKVKYIGYYEAKNLCSVNSYLHTNHAQPFTVVGSEKLTNSPTMYSISTGGSTTNSYFSQYVLCSGLTYYTMHIYLDAVWRE